MSDLSTTVACLREMYRKARNQAFRPCWRWENGKCIRYYRSTRTGEVVEFYELD
jgi:hypothetical protein